VIILGATRKRRIAERAFGRTIDYVIQHAPCEVLINLVPLEGVYAAAGADGADAPDAPGGAGTPPGLGGPGADQA